MANTRKSNTIFISKITGTLKFAETFKYGDKVGIKGAFETSRKDKDSNWINGAANLTIFQSTLRTADGEGFKDIEVEAGKVYQVELVAVEGFAEAYTDKAGSAAASLKLITGLKPTVTKTTAVGGGKNSSAPAGNDDQDDDIPF